MARYADSNGYQADYERYQWRWRDWVIDAFNQQHALRRVRHRAVRRGHAAERDPVPEDRHRVQPQPPDQHRRRRHPRRVADRDRHRPRRNDLRCLPRPDHGLRPLPRPQVRPDPAEGLLRFYAYFNNVPETGSGVEQPVNHPPFIKSPTPEADAADGGADDAADRPGYADRRKRKRRRGRGRSPARRWPMRTRGWQPDSLAAPDSDQLAAGRGRRTGKPIYRAGGLCVRHGHAGRRERY